MKIRSLLLTIALCIGLCACGQGAEQPGAADIEQNQGMESDQTMENSGETAGDANGYTEVLKYVDKNGVYVEKYFYGEKVGKLIQDDPNTGIYTLYEIYESGNAKRSVEKNSKTGAYWEEEMFESGALKRHIENNPETGIYTEYVYDENGSNTRWVEKNLQTGAYIEGEFYEDGSWKLEIKNDPETGLYTEAEYWENGTWKRSVERNTKTGAYKEQEFSESGNGSKTVSFDPATGIRAEEEIYDNGRYKRQFEESAERTFECRYTEDGVCVYYYEKTADREIELIGDETGKLIKCTENGEVKEDPAYLAEIGPGFGFAG